MNTDIKKALLDYVNRQQLVYQAISELRPDLFILFDKSRSDQEVYEACLKYLHIPGRGMWDKQGRWRYYMHGGGCRLTNVVTGEPLEWDVPDKEVFHFEWFINWYQWFIQDTLQENINPDEIWQQHDPAINEGYLERVSPGLYKINLK